MASPSPHIPVSTNYIYFLSLNIASRQTIINSFSFLDLCAFFLRVPQSPPCRLSRIFFYISVVLMTKGISVCTGILLVLFAVLFLYQLCGSQCVRVGLVFMGVASTGQLELLRK